ncbi:NAD-dependent epimerase/dehydratase family protein [Robbsia andropogonis]|uniref:NAD-dependent epimerase/dehydratase family protein n=1 Tax=Robbsia andropogonis TaxID=28092 RepID=UPI0020A15561|nr:NAD(P)-dependent oxidoreductase [Robbsia andropogonis]MCP1119117.1 NAD(P)-dependent oxidoreductase [Robbsia andropogonis]MCP1129032.1 NAD(P)-dependent oxidoreductase [Robbsia andropogonis]
MTDTMTQSGTAVAVDGERKPVVLTGAGGAIGRVLRAHFIETGRLGRYTDIKPLADDATVAPHAAESGGFRQGDLGDPAFCRSLFDGAGAIVHMAGISVEQPFDILLQHNYVALFHVYEAARQCGVRRIVYASSNHATGMYACDMALNPSMPVNPDSLYGLSKVWGEGLARLYWEKHGIETVCLRIGSFQPRPVSIRHLSTWLSHRDACALVDASLDTPDVGFDIVYGMSGNTRAWWDNSRIRVAYHPQDNAEDYAEQILADAKPVDALESRFQGADFAATDFSRTPPRES